MASSPLPLRSTSLPSRLHPNTTHCESKLQTLKSWQNPKSAPIISSEAIQSALLGLAELYNSVQERTQFPTTQQSLFLHGNSLEESVLEGSVELLDSCNAIKELVQLIKENVQSLQSALRRKGRGSIQSDIATYFTFRKKINNSIAKSEKKLKNLETKIIASNHSVNVDERLITSLRERTSVTIAIFKSILCFLSCPTHKSGRWNMVTTLMIKKSKSRGQDQCVTSEAGIVDIALAAKIIDVQMAQRSLQNLDSCIEGLESGLDRLSRELIRCRVTLLNILTNIL